MCIKLPFTSHVEYHVVHSTSLTHIFVIALREKEKKTKEKERRRKTIQEYVMRAFFQGFNITVGGIICIPLSCFFSFPLLAISI